ncbi:hypothetical protein K3495_g5913 [Podosphaera aphanis]|nr:hypothetical protein K3495_g5913 [Podosphaera aphanis]
MHSSSDFESSSFQAFDKHINSSYVSGVHVTPSDSSPPGEEPKVLPLQNDEFIAVIGGLGYIGSHTCLELLNAGYNVLVIDNLCNSFGIVSNHIYTLARKYHAERKSRVPLLHFREVDYRNETEIRLMLRDFMVFDSKSAGHIVPRSRIIGVIHFAAYKSVSESFEYPLKYYANNVAGLIEFCSILGEFNIKTFIFSSSASVYGTISSSRKTRLQEEHCVHHRETSTDEHGNLLTHEPGCKGLSNPYGRSKWMCEAILSDLARADREWAVIALRYFNPIGCDESGLLGEDPRGVPTNIMPVLMQVLSGQRTTLKIFGTDYPSTHDGTAVRDYIHVTDLARGHISALVAAFQKKGFRTYNLGSGKGYSVYDVVHAVEEASRCKIPIQCAPRREGDVESCVALPTRAEDELDWKAEKTLGEACRDAVNLIQVRNKGRIYA